MRYVALRDVKEGMILAHRITDPNGRILAEENRRLTAYSIEKLKMEGYDGIYIQDDLSADIIVVGPISNDLRNAGMGSVRKRDVYACEGVAERIVKEVSSKAHTALDLTDFRTNEDYIYAHSVNVGVLSCLVGMGFGLQENELKNLVWASLLHDIGKLDIPSIIRNKAGRLTREEYQIMKSHAMLSYEYIKNCNDISAHVKKAVRAHHENVDGSGYPDGTMGEEQSLLSKIIHVTDVYDALISRSPYKKPYSPQEVSEYLMGGCGILFDKDVVSMLLRYIPLYPKGTDVIVSDGRAGIIYENAGVHNIRPIVKLYDGSLIDLTEPENFNLTVRSKDDMAISEEYEMERQEMIKEIEKQRVLVVDDMKSNLQMMQDMLGEDYDVILAKSGQQALAYLDKKNAPDIILMDIDMPTMNGIDAARRIKEKSVTRIPLIFVTSLCDRETVMKCRELGPEGYIVRPYNPTYVKTEIKRILEGWGH